MRRILRPCLLFIGLWLSVAAADLATRFAEVAAQAPAYDPGRDQAFDPDKFSAIMRDSAEAFDRMGHSEPWAVAVRSILVDTALISARSPDAIPRKDLLARTAPLFEAGCREPSLVYFHGIALAWSGRLEESFAVLNEHRTLMYRSAYPVSRKFWYAIDLTEIAFEVRRGNRGWPQEIAPLWKELQEQDVVDRFPAPYLDLFATKRDGGLEEIRLAILEAMIAVTKPEHWMRPVLEIKFHINRAWQARGSGFAHTVTDTGWAGFRAHLAHAREAGLRGLDFPLSRHFCATELLTVSLGDQGARQRVDDWFMIAVSSDFNNRAPYDALRYFLASRWHGTVESQFGYCAMVFACNRPDTIAPTTGLSMLLDMMDEQHKANPEFGTILLRNPQMAAEIRRICEASIPAIPDYANWNRTWLCILALANDDEAEAARYYREAQGRLRQELFPQVLKQSWESVLPVLTGGSQPLIP